MNKETVELKSPRLYVSDTTPEAFVDLLADNDGRCSVISDEGNFLDILTGMYSKDSKANLDVFLKAHSGGSVKVKRKLSETCMDNIAASLGLCIQPQVLAGISYKGQTTLRGQGLFGRILFACPRHNLGTRDVRKRLPISDEVSKRYHAVVNTVLDVRVPKQDSQPRRITLTTDARELWHDFHQLVEAKLCDGAEFADMLDWAGKLPGAVLRICGLVEIVNAIAKKQSLRDDDIEINGSTMEAVIKFAWLLSRHAKLVFSSAGESPALVDARWICDHLSDFMETDKSGAKFVNRSSVHHHSRFNRNSIDFVEKAFKVLAERNIVSPIEGLRTGKRKAKLIHYVNPCWLQSKTAC
jgi:hypothetical protein